MNDLYSIKDVARIFDLEVSRLRYWAQTGFVNPSVRRGGRHFYTFQDLVALRTAKALLDAGLSVQRVRKNLESLRALLPDVAHPASKMHICSDGETVVAVDRGVVFEPATGQVVMSFAVDALSSEVADLLALPTPTTAHELAAEDDAAPPVEPLAGQAPDSGDQDGGDQDGGDQDDRLDDLDDDHLDENRLDLDRMDDIHLHLVRLDDDLLEDDHLDENEDAGLRASDRDPRPADEATPRDDLDDAPTRALDAPSAYQCFVQGCEAEDRGEIEVAEALFRQAIECQPSLAAAYTNLGNLLYRRGALVEARAAYEHALEHEPAQAEARFNLGNLLEDLGETEQAIAELRRVCWTHPDFADAHYNLGLVLARLGGINQARKHLERYLELESDSEWSDRARSFLSALQTVKPGLGALRW